MTKRLRMALPLMLALVVALALPTAPIIAQQEGVTIIAEGFNGPQGILVDPDGNIWVVDSGEGGDTEVETVDSASGETATSTYGETARITRIAPDGEQTDVAMLPSTTENDEATGGSRLALLSGEGTGGSRLALLDDELYVTSGAWQGDGVENPAPTISNTAALLKVNEDGTLEQVAPLWRIEKRMNPDNTILESHPYGVAAGPDGNLWVTDAGANTLLRIDPDSSVVELVTTFPAIPGVLPNPARGGEMLTDPVPTGLAFDDEGNALVATLSGAPFVPGSASVIKVTPAGVRSDYATNLTMLTDIRRGPDGEFYAVQHALPTDDGLTPNSGAIIKIAEGEGSVPVIEGLSFPTSVDFDAEGNAYVTINGVGAPGSGAVVKFDGVTEGETYDVTAGLDSDATAAEATAEPTEEATEEATEEPTEEATEEATATTEATEEATEEPTEEATATEEPTATATVEPTATATDEATAEPTEEATEEPTEEATEEPTATEEAAAIVAQATEEPTEEATEEATATTEATEEATEEPTEEATATEEPTATATAEPTATSTEEATATATEEPTATATEEPTATATEEPTATATEEPTATATEEPTATATEEPTEEPTAEAVARDVPSVDANDQVSDGTQVIIDNVVATQDGWLVIHADADGKPGPVLGQTAVARGSTNNVIVILDEPVEVGDPLWAMLHVDEGVQGVYEFPGPDVPVQIESAIVMEPFSVVEEVVEEPTAEPTEEPTAEATEEATAEATEEATAEATEEATEEAAAEVTEEPTAEVEATVEVTEEATEEATVEATEEPMVEATTAPTEEAMAPTSLPNTGAALPSMPSIIGVVMAVGAALAGGVSLRRRRS